MQKNYLIKVYHSYDKWKKYVKDFFDDIWKTLEWRKMTFWINFSLWETFFSFSSDESTYSAFESQFYSYFNEFQLVKDNKWIYNFDEKRTVVWELVLNNSWFFPFKYSTWDWTEFIFNIFRSFENFWVIKDKVSIFCDLKPIKWESFKFFVKSKIQYKIFKIKLFFNFLNIYLIIKFNLDGKIYDINILNINYLKRFLNERFI